MLLNNKSNSVRLTGRWAHFDDGISETTAVGSTIECAFCGKTAVLRFDASYSHHPFPHLYIIVDNGAKIETSLLEYLRIETENDGEHLLKIIFKSAVEDQPRWYRPLDSKVRFIGVEVEKEGTLPKDTRKTIEFIGDSITEGVLIDAENRPLAGIDTFNRPYQDDSTATYAYLTAEKLNLKPIIMGYGSVGITKDGCGAVPKAINSYPYCFNNIPLEPSCADITVINHGANDRANPEGYIEGYYEFLKLVRLRNPNTKIVALGAFCGFAADELAILVEKFNKNENDNVVYINTTGWIPKEPLHPLRDGHIKVSEKLAPELLKLL